MHCAYHPTLAITHIQQPSLRPLCQKCLSQTQQQKKTRLQTMRASLSKDFNKYPLYHPILQAERIKLDKLVELFVGKNMTEAKKLINKKSLQAQKVVETALEREVKEKNLELKGFVEGLLGQYVGLEGLKQLEGVHFEFDQEFLEIEEKVELKKKELKKMVVEKVKEEMRNFYQGVFDF